MLRKWHVSEALTSVRRLKAVLPELTEEEVLHVLTMEKQTLQRQSCIKVLVSQALNFYERKLHAPR